MTAGMRRFLEVNDAAVAQYGYSRDEFLLMGALDLAPRVLDLNGHRGEHGPDASTPHR